MVLWTAKWVMDVCCFFCGGDYLIQILPWDSLRPVLQIIEREYVLEGVFRKHHGHLEGGGSDAFVCSP